VFAQWEGRYKQAALALEEREQKLDGMAEEMEVGLTLVGATAVEDKLQVGVPECIQSLADAGIILWVLTVRGWPVCPPLP
jgi:magnesium-transporting ATPase (P-type)